jgi:hypothetical protein
LNAVIKDHNWRDAVATSVIVLAVRVKTRMAVIVFVPGKINAASGFVMLVTVCFTLGDIDDILATPTGYPFMQGLRCILNLLSCTLLVKFINFRKRRTHVHCAVISNCHYQRRLWFRDAGNGLLYTR